MDIYEKSIEAHRRYRGKLEVQSKVPLNTAEDLSMYYSPGVAQPCLDIATNPDLAYDYTWKNNSVAVVSDGTAVLGLGNIGGLASLPVMEGKAILFKKFANIDAVPIVLDTQDTEKIIEIVKAISPTFGGINLEDIGAPACFEIEEALQNLNIPVFHDDQHGTAIVVLAGLLNAIKLANKKIHEIRVVVSGAGASGIAVIKLLALAGVRNIITYDSKGSIHNQRTDLNKYKKEISLLNQNHFNGTMSEALIGADVFIGLSGQKDSIGEEEIKSMSLKPIVFGLSNPYPEINPELAKEAGAFIVATGRSDYPNQLNNVLAFPGIFRGALDARIQRITDGHKLAAAYALAGLIEIPTTDMILPSPFDLNVAPTIANAIINFSQN